MDCEQIIPHLERAEQAAYAALLDAWREIGRISTEGGDTKDAWAEYDRLVPHYQKALDALRIARTAQIRLAALEGCEVVVKH